jgi:RNA recognition motif-containing protein
MVEQNEDFGG